MAETLRVGAHQAAGGSDGEGSFKARVGQSHRLLGGQHPLAPELQPPQAGREASLPARGAKWEEGAEERPRTEGEGTAGAPEAERGGAHERNRATGRSVGPLVRRIRPEQALPLPA